ncbi:MAG: 5'-deoxynucleotidase [Deltaproteobacteria bacterium]|jgi:5'-deoxynucleotidase|nr:MAG: 5'-deoxynucleotidase [Deltaproteobacteria bacterium]TNF31384.1 MAG: 5'-deoxynucleotidase [Deltaproteobacteria bacterium]
MAHFFAYISRVKLIERWSLMFSVRKENVAEHSLQVGMIAHGLALIKNKYFDGNINADRVTTLAMYHDASEVITGDLPTPVKYSNPTIKEAYKAIEENAITNLLSFLPEDLVEDYQTILDPGAEDAEAMKLVKAADTLCAYIKCLEERALGNNEFNRAKATLEAKIRSYRMPEVDHFMAHYMNSFSLNLDELSSH